ncbi:MAG: AGE family epimerase/isomerase [Planctomycetota bacterium]
MCDHQFEFIRDKIYISSKKEFYKVVDSYGNSLQEGMHHYLLAFGIFALSNYAMAFPNTVYGQEALSMAKDVFYEMKNRSYDEVNGFDETVYSSRWCNDDKEINTQMHLMEAITYLYEAVKMYNDHNEEDVRSVLNNQVTLIYSKGIANQGDQYFCSRGYNKNWIVVNNWEVDYGHDIENVYLTMMAAKSLGRETEQAIINRVIELGKDVTTYAYDSNYGKWFYSGNPISGQINERVSNIWTNFEALNGLSTMYELTGETSYLEKYEKVLEWLEDEQMNDATKEWYYNVDDSGNPVNTDVFGGQCGWITFAWKSSYHSLRALMTRKEWIEQRTDLDS